MYAPNVDIQNGMLKNQKILSSEMYYFSMQKRERGQLNLSSFFMNFFVLLKFNNINSSAIELNIILKIIFIKIYKFQS